VAAPVCEIVHRQPAFCAAAARAEFNADWADRAGAETSSTSPRQTHSPQYLETQRCHEGSRLGH